MLVLTIRTDKPEAEIGLYDGQRQIAYEAWPAHRELSTTIHKKIDEILKSQRRKLNDIGGIVTFQGPGSFTGLRIGLTVANALAYALKAPIIGASGEKWIEAGIRALKEGKDEKIVAPNYGASPHITKQKH